jgi:hypothetical protein
MNFKFSNQIRMENEKGALLHWAASTEAWPSQLRSGPAHLACPWDRNRGLDPHPPAGSSLAKSGWPAAARRAWCYWAGSRGGEGPNLGY